MIEIYRWHRLDRWDAFTIPHLHIAPHLFKIQIGDLLTPRVERVDRSKWDFSDLQPITIHFGGEISRRKMAEGTDYSLPLFWVQPGDVVLSKIDLKNGAVGVLPQGWDNVVVTSHFRIYEPDTNRLDARYFQLLLRTKDFREWLWANRSGADGRTEVKLDIFESLEIPLPSLETQTSLCNEYNTALDYASKLEQEAQALEAAGWRTFEEALGLTPPPPLPDRPVFVARFKDFERWSHGGMLRETLHLADPAPKFPPIPVGSVGNVSYGLQKSPSNRPGSHPRPYLRVANVQRWRLDLEEIKFINVPDEEMPKYRLEDGDVLLCEGNSADLVGRGAIWRNEIAQCVHQNHVLRIRLDQTKAVPDFVLAVMNSSFGQAYFRSKAKRTTNLASINSKEVGAFPLPWPPVLEQTRLVETLDWSRSAAETKRREAQTVRIQAWQAFESTLFEQGG